METLHIIFGGASVEHDVSIVTALQTYNALKESYKVTLLYCTKDNDIYITTKSTPADYINKEELLKKCKKVAIFNKGIYKQCGKKLKFVEEINKVLNCCHGGVGEDGSLSAVLGFNNVASTSAGTCASAICMDKQYAKLVAESLNIPTVEYVVVDKHCPLNIDDVKALGDNVIVKPCGLGSSIGVVKSDLSNLKQNVEVVLHLDNKVLIEREIKPLVEYNCAVVRDGENLILSQIEQPVNKSDILSFEDKYITTDKTRIIPAEISEEKQNIIYDYTRRIYQAFGLSGVVRIDYLYDETNDTIYLNEINTIPGSLSYYLFEGLGITYIKLMEILIKNAQTKPLQPYFASPILENLVQIGK
ncbi:MAG: ATP-grasp domain-containing protein [Clostridia bacterium]|nr:ATP-grasp domain-containing protein [Clostridia bacterium]